MYDGQTKEYEGMEASALPTAIEEMNPLNKDGSLVDVNHHDQIKAISKESIGGRASHSTPGTKSVCDQLEAARKLVECSGVDYALIKGTADKGKQKCETPGEVYMEYKSTSAESAKKRMAVAMDLEGRGLLKRVDDDGGNGNVNSTTGTTWYTEGTNLFVGTYNGCCFQMMIREGKTTGKECKPMSKKDNFWMCACPYDV
eukprot:gnl/MRDRNA2_/MRDRNA2_74846_c0_seq2.p1 gnl/MRDRNA2_/MRDRNA2_74846_c0~~gnl/MRDRNA2_/MRDRNA2_74846_c0_seq2.p1  ORF type:complete len:200 (-),score=35.76 gnl/MRDRNA2_/MRDRNA2_74846_c0_seq2:234-833(-)